MRELQDFLTHAYGLVQDLPEGKRYFHTLSQADNSPVVVHEKTDQLTYVVEGSGTVYLNGIPQAISRKSVILVKATTTHRFVASEEGLVLMHLHIPDSGRESDRKVLEGEDYNRYVGNG